jgi:hypothetical protein
VIYYEGWLDDYAELFRQVDDAISPRAKAQLAAEVIFLTHNDRLHEVNLAWHPRAEELLWVPTCRRRRSRRRAAQRAVPAGAEGRAGRSILRLLRDRCPTAASGTRSDPRAGAPVLAPPDLAREVLRHAPRPLHRLPRPPRAVPHRPGRAGRADGRALQGEILPLWRFRTPELARASADAISALFDRYKAEGDFVGMDMARKFLQMGYTRSRRYANHRDGVKYDKDTGALLPPQPDPVKASSAAIFRAAWERARSDTEYLHRKDQHRSRFETPRSAP